MLGVCSRLRLEINARAIKVRKGGAWGRKKEFGPRDSGGDKHKDKKYKKTQRRTQLKMHKGKVLR